MCRAVVRSGTANKYYRKVGRVDDRRVPLTRPREYLERKSHLGFDLFLCDYQQSVSMIPKPLWATKLTRIFWWWEPSLCCCFKSRNWSSWEYKSLSNDDERFEGECQERKEAKCEDDRGKGLATLTINVDIGYFNLLLIKNIGLERQHMQRSMV
jgi:hypothetical protein